MFFTRKNIFLLSIFLVPLFFVWHAENAYFGLIPLRYTVTFLFSYLLLGLVLYIIGRLLTKNIMKAVCWATPLLIIFFFWGAFTDLLKKLHLPSFFTSNRFLLSLLIIFIFSLSLVLKKRKDPPVKLARFFFTLFGFLVLFEAINSLIKLSGKQLQKNNYSFYNKPLPAKTLSASEAAKPDIFFIVFDEYASSLSLKKHFAFDNSALDTVLSGNKFYIAREAKGNYNATPWSLASTLDADYFDLPLAGLYTEAKDLLKAQYTLRETALPVLLKSAGYAIKNYGLCDLEDAPAPVESLFDHDAWLALYQETLWARMESEIGWMFTKRFSHPVTGLPDPKSFRPVSMNVRNIESLYKELGTQDATPKFVFGHMLVPHDPYYFTKEGAMRMVTTADENPGRRDSLYIDQLKYINHWIDSLAVLSNKPFPRPRVIIIEGDHGRRDHIRENISYVYEKQFMNLNSYYFSDHDYSTLYDSISPVNSFRVVLNKYFHANLPFLKDSTILLH